MTPRLSALAQKPGKRSRMTAAMRRLGLRRLDNRGVTSIIFGVSATMIIGMVGLGTEAGAWYLTRRNSQDAADTAAYAGAVRLSLAGAQADAAARDTATRNGFTSGTSNTTVTVNTPPLNGAFVGNTSAVEVIVERSPPRLISALFINADPLIRTRGVAALTSNGPACVLALSVNLTVQGNSNVTMPGCSLASNATTDDAINLNGGPTIEGALLVSSGGCDDCEGLPVQTYQPPTTDPYAALNDIAYSTPTTCLPEPPKTGSGVHEIAAPAVGQGFCGNIDLTSNDRTWNFAPGVYVFWEGSLRVNGGSLTCTACVGGAGITFVFTGSSASKVGTVVINTNGTVTLTAPSSGTYAGVLIYRDNLGTSSGNPEVQINGGPNMMLSGAIYAPTSFTSFSGNSATNCMIVVSAEVQLSGTSNFSTIGCPATPAGPPMTQIVRLVE